MKKTLFILMCLVVAIECMAERYSILFNTGYRYIELVNVHRTDSATVINMRCTALPGDEFYIPKALYLEDENLRKYPLAMCKGVVCGERNKLPISGILDFELVFSPLPQESKVFDLRAIDEWYSSFAFWGIHPVGQNLDDICKYEDKLIITDNTVLKGGDVVIQGCIEDYDLTRDTSDICLKYYSLFRKEGNKDQNLCKIGEDGRFVFKVLLDCPSWTYMEYNKTLIPVHLIPGDTLCVSMNNLDNTKKKIEYRSLTGQNLMRGLLSADPKFELWENVYKRASKIRFNELLDELSDNLGDFQKLCGYLKWKYKLSEFETHLLYLNMKSGMDEITITRVNKNINSVYDRTMFRSLEKDELYKALTTQEMIECHAFLRNHDLNDFSYFMLPLQLLIRSLSTISMTGYTINHNIMQIRADVIEQYCGQQLNEHVKKVIGANHPIYK